MCHLELGNGWTDGLANLGNRSTRMVGRSHLAIRWVVQELGRYLRCSMNSDVLARR